MIILGVGCAIVFDELWARLFYLVVAVIAIRVYPNYPHWRFFNHGGVGFEINEICFGSVRPEKRIIYWRDVKNYQIEDRGWRYYLVVKLISNDVQEFDLGLYRIGGIGYLSNLMAVYSSRSLDYE